jgi:hypothetical protein
MSTLGIGVGLDWITSAAVSVLMDGSARACVRACIRAVQRSGWITSRQGDE